MRTNELSVLLLAIPLLALACSRNESSGGGQSQDASHTQPTTGATTRTLSLNSVNESDIVGTVTLTETADSLRLKLALEHLTPGDDYLAYIYAGSCDEQGPTLVPLRSVLAPARGAGSSATTVPTSELSGAPGERRRKGLFVQVLHPNETPAACVDLPSLQEGAM